MSDRNTSGRGGGFTEAERSAMLWRQQQKVERSERPRDHSSAGNDRYHGSSRSDNRGGNNRREDSRRSDSRDRRRGRSRSRSRSSHRRSNSRHRRPREDQPRNDSRPTSHTDDRGRKADKSRVIIDEFGREVPVERHAEYLAEQKRRQQQLASSRSSSRSRSRSRSGGRSRSHQSKGFSAMKWTHDKFDEHDQEDSHRDRYRSSRDATNNEEPYRPPSPDWISKAGGVAIMRRRPPAKEASVPPASLAPTSSVASRLFKHHQSS